MGTLVSEMKKHHEKCPTAAKTHTAQDADGQKDVFKKNLNVRMERPREKRQRKETIAAQE